MAILDLSILHSEDGRDSSARSPVPSGAQLARRFSADFPAASTESHAGSDIGRSARDQRTFRYLVFGMFILYIALAIGIYLWRGVFFTPDRWAVFLLVGAVILGRVGPFLRDWIPFVLLVFGYEFLRGIAAQLVVGDILPRGGRIGEMERSDFPSVRLENLIAFDRSLLFGYEPVSTLQDWLYVRGTVHWYDYFAVIVYTMHFILPCMFAFLLWIGRKERFWLFTLTFCFMTYGAFAFFLLYPAAPPWLADAWGVLPDIHWPQGQVTESIGRGGIQTLDTYAIWQNASPHPVAAMPSLHAGFPWLVMLFAIRYFRWWGLLFIPYNVALWYSVIYTSNHWVVDILAGMAWATISFAIVDIVWLAISVDQFVNVPAPVLRTAIVINRSVFRPLVRLLAPVWHAPGHARRWARQKLSPDH
ncbi:MAG: hypothetical protein AVDCRST_MAG43-1160 [uncultured Thermomicrobiales bacterium]|uniref:Inositolphosphotransferase Aur1/Ipt1 domain-containing protein n=1 Tax=uncultured Thermomicrobiales bacterium TaxID=1645740 RepID=A0A6J4UMI8_9BACT|nr:MAG: hypothetical protein AVDCRST_MAG43-1160 [uncultured Thermomicrobiales bacterium]